MNITSYSPESSWTTPNQVFVIVMIALAVIAATVGSYVFLESQFGISPFGAMGTIGEMGGGFLIAGGGILGIFTLILAIAIETRRRHFIRHLARALDGADLNNLETRVSFESVYAVVYRISTTEAIAFSARDKELAEARLTAWKQNKS